MFTSPHANTRTDTLIHKLEACVIAQTKVNRRMENGIAFTKALIGMSAAYRIVTVLSMQGESSTMLSAGLGAAQGNGIRVQGLPQNVCWTGHLQTDVQLCPIDTRLKELPVSPLYRETPSRLGTAAPLPCGNHTLHWNRDACATLVGCNGHVPPGKRQLNRTHFDHRNTSTSNHKIRPTPWVRIITKTKYRTKEIKGWQEPITIARVRTSNEHAHPERVVEKISQAP